jgi:acyl-CoA dehydrogenase
MIINIVNVLNNMSSIFLRAAYETALAYGRTRKQLGHAIIENHSIYSMFADMVMEIETARLLVWKAA